MGRLSKPVNTVKVSVGVVRNAKGEILLAQRPLSADYGGLWEFPGGKVELNETTEQALVRELKEEIGIELKGYQWLMQVHHHYPNKQVELNVWTVHDFCGDPQGVEGQCLKWVSLEQLRDYPVLTANDVIIDAITQKRDPSSLLCNDEA